MIRFDELTDRAKESARDWLREANSRDNYPFELLTDEFRETVAPAFGFSGYGRHKLAETRWSGFSSQGDGASFSGCWSLYDVNLTPLLADRPAGVGCKSNDDLHRVAAEMAALCAEIRASTPTNNHYDNPMDATITTRGHHCHEYEMQIESGQLIGDQKTRLLDIARTLARWLYRQLDEENDATYSAEYIDDQIRANEYEFTEAGKIA
mgnify:CR=1 FL=1